MKNDIKYLLGVISNFGLLDTLSIGLDPTMYHTGSYEGDLKIHNKLKEIQSTVETYYECIYEPRGDHGLEGYQLGEKYLVRQFSSKFYGVYPDESDGYYEICSKHFLNKYFKLLVKKE